jgi:hypothetical protein
MADEGFFSKLSSAVKPFAPLLSTALDILPVPGAKVVGKALEAAFNGNIEKPDELANKITLDPQAALKLAEIEGNNRVQLENIAMQHAYNMMSHDEKMYEHEVEDRKNARDINLHTDNRSLFWVDPAIKLIIVGVVSAILIGGLYAIIAERVDPEESNLLGQLMGGAWTTFVGMAGFYWGTSWSSRQKDEALAQIRVKK